MAIDQYGQIIRRSPRPIPIRTNPNVGYNPGVFFTPSHHYTLWGRFDGFIGGIGNWIANVSETITGILVIIILACFAVPFISWLISLGWLWGITAGVFLGGIVYYAAMVVAGIFAAISNVVLAVFRYIFYSGTTFLLTLAIVGSLYGYRMYSSSDNTSQESNQEVATIINTTKYRCTARSTLRVRSAPSSDATAIGSLIRNEVVDVYEITDGFARIKYGDRDGYASVQYLKPQ